MEQNVITNQLDQIKTNNKLSNYIDKPSLRGLVGDVTDKTIIDYGCSTGQYTRMFGQCAKQVVGVDISTEMIEQANKLKRQNSVTTHLQDIREIHYYVRDCTEILDLGQFDVVISAYLLCLATDRSMLKKFVKSMFESLKPGGGCYALTANFHLKQEDFNTAKKYNLDIEFPKGYYIEGNPMNLTFLDMRTHEPLFKVTDYYMEPSVVEKTFEEVGFVNFKWVPITLGEKYSDYETYFTEFFKHPWSIMISAEKPI